MILLATRNPGKIRDLKHLFPNLALVELPPTAPDVDETGQTFEANALLKAYAAAATGLPALGDDSGLEVDALGGAPGVYSARWAADTLISGATRAEIDAANNRKLLDQLAGIPTERRTARFRSVLVFVDADHVLIEHGTCEGWILQTPVGQGGFGYDPLFFCPELGKGFGEASLPEKARVSHRARAAARLAPRIEAHFTVANRLKSR